MTLLFGVTLSSCGYDKFVPVKPEVPDTEEPDYITIAELTSRHAEGGATILTHEAICGRVISDDKEGNFFKSLIVEDTTGSVELRFGTTNLESLFPCNSTVRIAVRGLTLGRSQERTYQLGFASDNKDEETAEIPTLGLIQRYVLGVDASEVDQSVKPLVIKVNELVPQISGRLVRIEGLQIARDQETWATPADMSSTGFPTDNELMGLDSKSRIVHVYTSGYASFSGDTIPKDRVNLTGILFMKNSKEFRLRMRSRKDIEIQK